MGASKFSVSGTTFLIQTLPLYYLLSLFSWTPLLPSWVTYFLRLNGTMQTLPLRDYNLWKQPLTSVLLKYCSKKFCFHPAASSKRHSSKVFSCEFSESFQNNLSAEHHRVTWSDSEIKKKNDFFKLWKQGHSASKKAFSYEYVKRVY